MLSFVNDYSEGAHEKILERLERRIVKVCPVMERIATVNLQRRRSDRHASVRMQMFIFL